MQIHICVIDYPIAANNCKNVSRNIIIIGKTLEGIFRSLSKIIINITRLENFKRGKRAF